MIRVKLTSESQAGRLLGAIRRQTTAIRQADLAKLLHVSHSTIRRRERGDIGLPLDALIAAAKRLGCDVVLVSRSAEEPSAIVPLIHDGPPAGPGDPPAAQNGSVVGADGTGDLSGSTGLSGDREAVYCNRPGRPCHVDDDLSETYPGSGIWE